MVATSTKPRLQAKFQDEVRPALLKEFGLPNVHAAPTITKVVINSGVGRFLENQKLKPDIADTVQHTLGTISGQRPVLVKAKRSVANFKVREDAPSAFMVTIRRDRMWHFLDRLMNLAIPRIKDFRGVKTTSFDRGGTYSLGLTEQAVWPEINMADFSFTHGMHVNIVFRNSDPAKSRFVLAELGMPFAKPDDRRR